MIHALFRAAISAVVVVVLSGSGGCSSNRAGVGTSGDPIADMLDSNLQTNVRMRALESAWAEGQSGQTDPAAVRDAMKRMIFKFGAPEPLRREALAKLLEDEAGMADTRNLLRLVIPLESSWPVLTDMCDAVREHAADGQWRTLTASLVHSYSRAVPYPTDDERPERAALAALHPDKSIQRVAFEVFESPAANGAVSDDQVAKARQGAWDLLARLDADGRLRAEFLARVQPSGKPEDVLTQLGKAAKDLGVVPLTGFELAWLQSLLKPGNEANARWWSDASEAVATLRPDQSTGLELRHIEPIRWAAAHDRELLATDRDGLLSQLTQRLESRRLWRIGAGGAASGLAPRQTLRECAADLSWADLLAILVIDKAVRDELLVAELQSQVAADRTDTSTEYGGMLVSAGTGPQWKALGFSPRPTERVNDRTFVASRDMIASSDRSLAHYHFHVQTDSNAEYAAPGKGDHEYAAAHNRSCVVFTTVRRGVVDADYYQRGGVSIDLGEIELSPTSTR